MLSEKNGNEFLVVTNKPLDKRFEDLCYVVEVESKQATNNMNLVFPYIVVAQILGLKKASNLGISSDNPCPSGSVNRVVKGVNIYNF